VKTDRVPLLKNEDVLIVPIHDELNDQETRHLEKSLLTRIEKSDVNGVVLDISSVETIDLYTARKLLQLVNMIALMDVRSVIVGMRPAVAITLTDMEVHFPNVDTALTLDQGLAILKGKTRS
jgi:rsbT antagonist protein RsbS